MKHSLHTPHWTTLAAPLCAMTLSCLAQTSTTVVVPPANSSAVVTQADLHATGNIRSIAAGTLTMINDLGSMTVYLTNADTEFLDKQGLIITPSNLTPQTPVTVHYTPVGNTLLATRVVVSSTLSSDGVLREVGPGALVVGMSGVPGAPVRYTLDGTTKYVDQKGRAIPAIASGDPVRIFYARVGDTLVATKVQVLGPNGAGVPAASVKTQTKTTTVTREVKR
jgi:hypothetical protein